ncbi:uncharacterized protein RJT21DRAFT_119426 [Scheffersomyces amazonensis]|uniref:uncharacterized protein n=1 Tax=Scheffersomyces amazonensis TaxID=1078765 RepID=UPI00315D8F83
MSDNNINIIPLRKIISEPFVNQMDLINKATVEARNQPSSPYINNNMYGKNKRRGQQGQQGGIIATNFLQQYQQYYNMKNESMYGQQYQQPQMKSQVTVPVSTYSSPAMPISSYSDLDFTPRKESISTSTTTTVTTTRTPSIPSIFGPESSTTASTYKSSSWNSGLFDPFEPVELKTSTINNSILGSTSNSTTPNTATVSNIWGPEPSGSRIFNNTVWA